MEFKDFYKGKKVLITGHTGFKGSWLAIWLKTLGAEVFGYALAPTSDLDNFVSCDLENKINHKIGDVTKLEELTKYFNEVQPDIAFHLAAQPLVLLSYLNPVDTFNTNIMGVVNFFEAVKNTKSVKVAINITSDKCYDNREWVWGYRENDPMGGKDPYSASKGCAELITNSYLKSFFQDSSCNIASARAGNVIGGGDWAVDRIVPDFFRSIFSNTKMLLRNPYATRPWQHVLEPLSGYLTLGYALSENGSKYTGGWNFGPEDGSNYNVKELIDKIIEIHEKGGYEIPDNLIKPHEASLLKLDISKAVNELLWKPCLNFEQTVSFTIEGYKNLPITEFYDSRVNQIKQYAELAKLKNIDWAL